jgi:hypothetical protein
MFAHQDLVSLHKNVPKQNLPSDYGGELQSVEELLSIIESFLRFVVSVALYQFLEVWDETFTKKKCYLEKIEQLSQRNNEDQGSFGIQGSFKTLSVD